MKRKRIVLAAGVMALLLTGCGDQQRKVESIALEEAKYVALQEANLAKDEVEFTSELCLSRDGQDYYQIVFSSDENDYQYDIDALTGAVIQGTATPRAQEESIQESDTQASVRTGENEGMISVEEAKSIVLQHAGFSEADVTFEHCGLECEDGIWRYEIEFCSAGREEYDYDVNAYTKEILAFDRDAEHIGTNDSNGAQLTQEQAKEMALERVPGASSRDIYEFSMEHEDGSMEYEGKIIYEGVEYEFEIDAYSGTFRKWETETSRHFHEDHVHENHVHEYE